jgi:hypothetical protein
VPRTRRHLISPSYHRVTQEPGDKNEALHQSEVELATRVSNVSASDTSGCRPFELQVAGEAAWTRRRPQGLGTRPERGKGLPVGMGGEVG